MVDALVSNVIQQLKTIVQKEIEQEVRLIVGVKKDVDKLSSAFAKIQAVLKDAEERQIKENSVRLWLQDLKDLAYDIDDVLDEWSTEILKSQIDKVSHGNLFSLCCFYFKRISSRHDIGHRIKEIKEKLDDITTAKNKFGFTETTSTNDQIIHESRRKLETSSLVDVSEVFGRDMEKEIIISKLLSEGSTQEEVLPLISIVGMGGMGKTTLAQLAFNDDRVKNHFNKRMWIYVSKSFDKVTIAMNIIKEIDGINIYVTAQGCGHNITWEAVHRQLNSYIDGKHFLLVLDDVWNENPMEWDPLRLSLKSGARGSKIIVTTRNERVADIMGTTYVYNLGILSDKACWSLLRYYASVGRQEEVQGKKEFEEIGMKLAEKCKGLPLSAKTLGSHLRFKKSKQDWQDVLESDLWKVVSTDDKPVFPTLLLSYYDLPSHLKQCFAYCSLIPKRWHISKWTTIREWMAQGFISDNLATSTSDEDLITVGNEYFNNLVMRSFFEKDIISEGPLEFLRMHDLVYDFAKSFVEKECFTLMFEDTNAHQESNFSRARHLSLSMLETNIIPSFIYKAKNLRTLITYGPIPALPSELFHRLTCLRTLCLYGDSNLEEVPNEIRKLIHLRYIHICGGKFNELPKTVTNLYNLQILCLDGCQNLRKLPEEIWRLVNLIELILTDCNQLSYLPEGIGKLTKLRGLSHFIVGGVERGGCNIGELKDLNFLKDTLCIIGLGRVKNGNEAKMACLKNKQHLRALYFYFNQYSGLSRVDEEDDLDEEGENTEEETVDVEGKIEAEEGENIEEETIDVEGKIEGGGGGEEKINSEGNTKKEEEEEVDGGDMLSRKMEDVLESLQPNPSLEKLIIRDYLGAVFPNWIVSHADFMIFSNLVFLEFGGCRKCKQLPPTLGKLPSLETLVIAGMDKVKFMGVEFFGIDGATKSDTIFPKLKVFLLSEMINLEEWDMRMPEEEDWKQFIFMPHLQHIYLIELPKLRSLPQHLIQATSLRKLMIWHCPKLTWIPSPSSHLPFLYVEELILKKDTGSFSKSLITNNHHMFLPKLKLLRVRESPYSSLPQGLGKLTSLEILDIRTCSKIKSIPEGELQHLTALQELTIMRCPTLRQRCQKDIGEDWSKISHIPKIFIDDQKIK
ncbi:hypothetical protein NE237_006874 [Protea cynaroides]|uniref:Uncharacterized protein n=1 Tax=Protea cynaroides TaxID=273540 RepID=A0A9Q0KNE4_9MAGN|nr:hypothetical protein NE237_006874 [Protea cynaroides]